MTNWILPNDQKPQEGQSIIVTALMSIRREKVVGVAYFENGKFKVESGEINAVAWMPLPEAFEEKEVA